MKNSSYEENQDLIKILQLSEKAEANIAFLQNLQYLKNKDFMLKSYNPNFSIGAAEKMLIQELEARWLWYSLDKYWYSLRIFLASGEVHLTQGINYGLNSTSVVKIFQNKILTNHILREEGLNLPDEFILEPRGSIFENSQNNQESLLQFVEKVWYPLIVKPHKWSQGENIRIISSQGDLEKFCEYYQQWGYWKELAIIQKYIEWDEFRVIYLNGEALLAYKKTPLTLIGDGKLTLQQLLAKKRIPEDKKEEWSLILQEKGYALDDVLSSESKVQVFDYINNASEKDVVVGISEEDKQFIDHIAKSFGANYFWLDIKSGTEIHKWTILEINAKPDVLWARRLSTEFNMQFPWKVIDAIQGISGKSKKSKEVKDLSFDVGLTEDDFFEKVASLQFLQNKAEILQSKNGIKHGIFLLLDEIEKSGFPYTIDEYGFVLTIHLPNGKNRIIYNADYGLDNSALRRIFEDKIYTSKILRQAGFKVANDMLVIKESSSYTSNKTGREACVHFAQENGYPLIFKPNDWSLGAGVVKIFNQEQLISTLNAYNVNGKGLQLLQAYIPGKDYRVIYLDGEILTAYERIPPTITGDWEKTIAMLIEEKFSGLHTEKIFNYLKDQNISQDDILPVNQELPLLPTANIAIGGIVKEVETTQADREFLERVANTFWARYFWADILTDGALADGVILEINKSPITKGISGASPEFQKIFAQRIWQAILEDENL